MEEKENSKRRECMTPIQKISLNWEPDIDEVERFVHKDTAHNANATD